MVVHNRAEYEYDSEYVRARCLLRTQGYGVDVLPLNHSSSQDKSISEFHDMPYPPASTET